VKNAVETNIFKTNLALHFAQVTAPVSAQPFGGAPCSNAFFPIRRKWLAWLFEMEFDLRHIFSGVE